MQTYFSSACVLIMPASLPKSKKTKCRNTKTPKTKCSIKKAGKRWAVVVASPSSIVLFRQKPATAKAKHKPAAVPKKKIVRKKSLHHSPATTAPAKRKSSIQPKKKPSPQRPATTAPAKRKSSIQSKKISKASNVYVLQLEGGYVYVGKTSRPVQKRLEEHMSRSSAWFKGAAFTKLHKPTGKLLPRLGNLEGDGDGPERDETLRQMYKRGVHKVRGWKYVRASVFRREELDDIECNMRELLDLCRRCGKKGHFATHCKESKDRGGNSLGCVVRPNTGRRRKAL